MGANMEKTWFTVRHLYPRVWAFVEFGHNEMVISYLFVGKKKCLLFDSGMGIGNLKKEIEKISKLPLILVNSHCHFDHIGENYKFLNIAIFDSKFSKNISKKGYLNNDLKPYLKSNYFLKIPPKNFSKKNYQIPSFKYTKLLKNGEKIKIDPFVFTIISTPGHTPDSICLYESKNKLLLTGDTLYPGPIYLHFRESNLKDYIKSIKKIIALEKQITDILPGHNFYHLDKKVLKIIYKKLYNFENIKNKKLQVGISNISFVFK